MSVMEKRSHLKIPFADIKDATKDFQNEIRSGGWSREYEGKLLINGIYMKVAVKRLYKECDEHSLKEFSNEIDLLSGQRHENLITLVGYCDEEDEKITVYEHAENGSLDFYFRSGNENYNLTWVERLKIVVDVATGLDHLHNHLPDDQVIIHGAMRSSNIFLDHKWVAKISEFGSSIACGPHGYLNNTNDRTRLPTIKSDVYFFGMVLLEVLYGRLDYYRWYDNTEIELAKEYYANGELHKIIDPILMGQMSPNSLKKYSAIAIECVKPQEQRPLMDVVKRELEEALKIEVSTNISKSYPQKGMEKWKHLQIPFEDIKNATNNFDNDIGRGAYGGVYKGKLSINGNDRKVAVKRLIKKYGQGLKEFMTEIHSLSGQQHVNLITLVGYCNEENEKIIVYEFAEYGSLDRYIRRTNRIYTLTWVQRLNIAIDVATGLDHLQNGLGNNHAIIHRDIKSANILLDDKWVAKVADFGLSKSTSSEYSGVSRACGTPGYMEPEYARTGLLTNKSDVYSFGMVLFEILCGRLCNYPYEDGITLSAKLAKEYFAKGELDTIIDPTIREQMSPNSLRKFATTAISCLKPREHRPLMHVVKRELEEARKIQFNHSTPTNQMSGMKLNLQTIPFEEIKNATKGFTNHIAKVAHGLVYEGELFLHGMYTKVRVKRIDKESRQAYYEFLTEIHLLATAEHDNLTTIVGYCDEGDEKIIVYEYCVDHTSLDQYIKRGDLDYTLTWLERLKIVVDAVRGLAHLHHYTEKHGIMINNDIRTSNILLDHKRVPKISTIGLYTSAFSFLFNFTICQGERSYENHDIRSTVLHENKSDVYSFGMILFEVLCGRLCAFKYEDDIILTAKIAKEYYDDGKLDNIIDPSLRKQMSTNSLSKFSAIAYKCLHHDPRQRPVMDVVKKELEETLKIEVLHWRSFISRHWSILNVEDLTSEIDG